MSFSRPSSIAGNLGYNGFPVSISYFVAVPEVLLIEDANVAVLFKALSKKNSVTREKNLGDLVKTFNDSSFTLTDNTIMCWIQAYPKVAIDNSKTVRLLAHQVQGTLLRRVGGREFGKYLKSTIPIWLLSLYDQDTPVSKASYKELLESFQNDSERVNTKLWLVFSEQIVNYIYVVVCVETHESLSDLRYTKNEDSIAKYDRSLTGAIFMLCKLINLINEDSGFSLQEDSLALINELLRLENLWEHLGRCSDIETINLGLFKAYLGLLKCSFELKENHSPSRFISQLDDVKGLYKLVSKNFIKNIKLNVKEKTQSIIFSSVIIQFWDTLNVLTAFTQMSPSEKKKIRLKKNFWESAGSKAHSRLINYIRLGHCNSDPLFYNVLTACLKNIASIDCDESAWSFGNSKDTIKVVDSLLSQFKKLPTFSFKRSALECIFNILDILNCDSSVQLRQKAFMVVIDGLSSKVYLKADSKARENSISLLASFKGDLDFESFNKEICASLESSDKVTLAGHQFEHPLSLVAPTYVAVLSDEMSDDLADRVLISMLDIFEDPGLTRSFELLIQCIKKSFSPEFKEWTPLLPSFCTSNFIDLPFEVLRILLDENVGWVDLNKLIDDVFIKVLSDAKEALAKLLALLNKAKSLDEKSVPHVREYLEKLSRTEVSSSDSGLLFNYIDDPAILRNLLASPSVHEKPNDFLESVVSTNTKLDNLGEESRGHLRQIITAGLQTSNSRTLSSFLSLVNDDAFVANILSENIILDEWNIDELASIFKEHPEYFPLNDVNNLVHRLIESIDLNSIAISNPLHQNVYLASQYSLSEASLQGKKVIVKLAIILREVIGSTQSPSSEIIILALLTSEYLHDYLFLRNETDQVPDALLMRAKLDDVLAQHLFATKASTNGLFNDSPKSTAEQRIIERLVDKGPYSIHQLYCARYLTRVLSSTFDGMSPNEFEALDVKTARLVNQPLLLSVYLTSAAKFIGVSKTFDRMRNYVFAEILGVKSSQDILDLGKVWLSLATNFLVVDTDEYPDYELIPQHKLGMLISHLMQWLDSDIAYSDEFLSVRSLLAVFFSHLLILDSKFVPDKTWDIAFDLALNNLSSAQVEVRNVGIRFFTIKLCTTLFKKSSLQDAWKEARESVTEELVDLILNEDIENFNSSINNQPVRMTNELLRRLLSVASISDTVISNNSEKFLKVLQSSHFVDMQRLSANLLEKDVISSRDDFVVEYQLNKANLSDSQDNLVQAKLPMQLVKYVASFNEDLELLSEKGEEWRATSYLWSWLLIFAYFKGSTYGIRTDYISQLKESQCIEHLLNVIFDHVDLTDSKFLRTLVDDSLDKVLRLDSTRYSIAEYSILQGCPGEDTLYEMKFVLVHLYFRCLQYLGSYCQQWFSELRDLQLKRQIEKFSIKFVSPLIISKMLNEVEQAKSKLTQKDENLTIKVNKITNEIRTIYIIDEQKMEMVVKIPDSFPLSNVMVLGPLRLGVKENQWKAWLLASQRVVSLTNGSIIDCIELFNRNVSLHFSGFEECAICYSILHQDHSLPSKNCQTCLNKFHAACLYKWFKSSGSSTCPLCRSAFNFRISRA